MAIYNLASELQTTCLLLRTVWRDHAIAKLGEDCNGNHLVTITGTEGPTLIPSWDVYCEQWKRCGLHCPFDAPVDWYHYWRATEHFWKYGGLVLETVDEQIGIWTAAGREETTLVETYLKEFVTRLTELHSVYMVELHVGAIDMKFIVKKDKHGASEVVVKDG